MIPNAAPNMDPLFKRYLTSSCFIDYRFCLFCRNQWAETNLRCQMMFQHSPPPPCPLAACCYGAHCDRRKHPPGFFSDYGGAETDVAMGHRNEDRTCRCSQTHHSSCLGGGDEIPGGCTKWDPCLMWLLGLHVPTKTGTPNPQTARNHEKNRHHTPSTTGT